MKRSEGEDKLKKMKLEEGDLLRKKKRDEEEREKRWTKTDLITKRSNSQVIRW